MTAVPVALAIHVTGVVVAFGPLFAYPVLTGAVRRSSPGALPAVYRAQHLVARRVTTPALPITLVAGVYLALEDHVLGELWVLVPMVMLLALMVLHRVVLLDGYRRLADGAHVGTRGGTRRGLDDPGRRVQVAQSVSAVLVVFTIYVMAAKPVA